MAATVGSGDLTRLGWHSNNRYGPRKPNLAFRPSLVTQGSTIDRHYDVVVVGDSFSLDLEKSWPNYLAAKGLSVLVIGSVDGGITKKGAAVPEDVETQIRSLIQSPAFRDTPPSIFVFETIERFLKRRLVNDEKPCTNATGREEQNVAAAPIGAILAEPPKLRYSAIPKYQIKELNMPAAGQYDMQQLTYARDFLVKNIKKVFARHPITLRFEIRLPRFSSDQSKTLLVISEDLSKKNWNQKNIEEMECQLLSFQKAVQSNGKTLFVALPIPDKLSAYHDDLVDLSPPPGVIDQLTDPSLNRPKVEKTIRAEIAKGEMDIYLPNDTHFGARGQELTAETVLNFINERTHKVEKPDNL